MIPSAVLQPPTKSGTPSFTTFLATLLPGRYMRNHNQEVLEHFDGALGYALMEHCRALGMSELRDTAFIVTDPSKNLDPINRWEEYRTCFLKERGKEVERFGKWVGRALDPPNYPALEVIGGAMAETLFRIANEAMSSVFQGFKGHANDG